LVVDPSPLLDDVAGLTGDHFSVPLITLTAPLLQRGEGGLSGGVEVPNASSGVGEAMVFKEIHN